MKKSNISNFLYNQLAVYFQIRIVCRNNRSKKNIKLIIKVDIEYISNSIEPDENGFYFGNLTESAVTHNFHKICPNHKLHDLSHTFGTRSNENDVDMKVVQKLMGHSSYKITADTYTSVFSPTITRETKKVNDYFDSNFGFIFDTKIDTDFDTTNQKN